MKVVVADAAAHVRSALRLLLEQHAAVSCIAELATGDRLLAEVERTAADVLLVDSQIPDVDVAYLLPILRQAYPRLRVVVLSSRPEDRERALSAGADAFVSKGDAPEGLYTVLSPGGSQSVRHDLHPEMPGALTFSSPGAEVQVRLEAATPSWRTTPRRLMPSKAAVL